MRFDRLVIARRYSEVSLKVVALAEALAKAIEVAEIVFKQITIVIQTSAQPALNPF